MPEKQNNHTVLRAVYRLVARLTVWIYGPLAELPDGCPNCGFAAVENREIETCPFCGWGPDSEPERTAKEARHVFLERTMDKVRPW